MEHLVNTDRTPALRYEIMLSLTDLSGEEWKMVNPMIFTKWNIPYERSESGPIEPDFLPSFHFEYRFTLEIGHFLNTFFSLLQNESIFRSKSPISFCHRGLVEPENEYPLQNESAGFVPYAFMFRRPQGIGYRRESGRIT